MSADVMVTARMSREKKDTVAQILGEMGTNASEAINDFYDYIRVNRALPFEKNPPRIIGKDELSEALAFIDSLSIADRFSDMTDEEIRRERMIARGYMDEGDFL